MAKLNSSTRPNKRGPMPPRRRSKARHVPVVIRVSKRRTVSHARGRLPTTVDLVENAAVASMAGRGSWLMGVVLVAAWALTSGAAAPPVVAAPLRLVTDQWIPYENLSDADAPGFSTEVLTGVFASMKQEVSFEELPWALLSVSQGTAGPRQVDVLRASRRRRTLEVFVARRSGRPRHRRATGRVDLARVLGLRAPAAHDSRDGER